MKRFLIILFLLTFIISLLCGCEPVNFTGPNEDLHTVGIRSVLGAMGGWYTELEIIETDPYGRKMFLFDSLGWRWEDSQLMLLIAQPTVGSRAYFYDGKNMIYVMNEPDVFLGSLSKEVMLEYFSQEQIENLKALNDWGKEVDYSKCFSAEIVRLNEHIHSDRELRRAVKDFPEPFPYHSYDCELLAEDADGKSIYFITSDARHGERAYVFILDEKGKLIPETGVMELTEEDWVDYREMLYDFKVQNGWNFYISIEEVMQLNGESV